MDTKNIQDIINKIQTTTDQHQMLSLIDTSIKSLFITNKNLKEFLDKDTDSEKAELFESLILNSREKGENTKEILLNLRQKIKELKSVRITISFSPGKDTISAISNFIRENFGENIILEIEEDETILGGAIIESGGKYIDLSLKKQLNEIFEKKRTEITSLLK